MKHYDFIIEFFFVLILIFFALKKQEKSKLDKSLIVYLTLQCSGIFIAILSPSILGLISGSIVLFAVTQIVMVGVIARMILIDVNSKRKILWSPIFLGLVFLLFSFSSISSADFLHINFPKTSRTWFTYLQYADFTSLASVVLLINIFFWLYHLILTGEHSSIESERRYMVIGAFLFFYGGSFFILVFGRLLLADSALWLKIMNFCYRPMYLTSYVIITLAVRWKSVRSLFWGHYL